MTRSRRGFTLIELLIVMAVLAILAALVLLVAGFIQRDAARKKARIEIATMSAALENYKADHGVYPREAATDALDPRVHVDAAQPNYQAASLVLYRQLSGDRNANNQIDAGDRVGPNSPQPTIYMEFKPVMLGGVRTGTTLTTVQFIADPFGRAYGYSTAQAADVEANPTNPPRRGYEPGYDLWCTAGSTEPVKWVKSW